jgi:hypothetical protein
MGEIAFSDSDCSGYAPVNCPCGNTVGAKLIVGGIEDVQHLDGIWFVLNRVEGVQGTIHARLDSVLAVKPAVHLGIHGRGQQVLSCLPDD